MINFKNVFFFFNKGSATLNSLFFLKKESNVFFLKKVSNFFFKSNKLFLSSGIVLNYLKKDKNLKKKKFFFFFFINFFFFRNNLLNFKNFNIIILKFLKKNFFYSFFKNFNMIILKFLKFNKLFLKKKKFIKKWLKKNLIKLQ